MTNRAPLAVVARMITTNDSYVELTDSWAEKGVWVQEASLRYRNLIISICEDLEYRGTITFAGPLLNLRNSDPKFKDSFWYRVKINDPAIQFTIGVGHDLDVMIHDDHRSLGSKCLYASLKHPLSVNRLKSFIKDCAHK
jgi:hypothetical protein